MAINRSLFLKEFPENAVPSWPCPSCDSGSLVHDKNNTHYFDTAESITKQRFSSSPWDKYGSVYSIFRCSNPKCDEKIIMHGQFNMGDVEIKDEASAIIDVMPMIFIEPSSFQPPIRIFPINKSFTKDISKKLVKSFNLFWLDIDSCANKARIIVEDLLTFLKIKRFVIVKGKRSKLSLNNRIDILKNKNNDLAEKLMAIKWIGNHGSHSDNLTRDDVLDGLEILESALNMIFNNEDKRIQKIVKEIASKKKPRSKK
jgi:hypothetical protein